MGNPNIVMVHAPTPTNLSPSFPQGLDKPVFHLIPYLYDSLPCMYHPKYRWLMEKNKIKIVGNVAMF